MSNSNSTVSVGKTDFPLRSKSDDHRPLPLLNPSSGGLFRLLDGPPYANGLPHLGHVLNKHLKDVVARSAASLGHSLEWRPGWDCHGLPLELAVEKLGGNRQDPVSFVQQARHYATQQALGQKQVFEQQGWAAQWDQPWHTQDPAMEANTLRVFADLLDRGVVDVRFSCVPWCGVCQSTLSNAEQEEKEVERTTMVVPFYLDEKEALLSWTTTPWTLPLHQVLVVNPEGTYCRLEKGDEYAWVAEPQAKLWAEKLGAKVTGVVCQGEQLAGRTYKTPWKEGVVQSDDSVLVDAGTGVLHAVPGLSELDTALGARREWPVYDFVQPNGVLQHSPCEAQNGVKVGELANACVYDAYQNTVWMLKSSQTLEVAHCWRHHTPLLSRPSRQVFLHLDNQVRARADALLTQLEMHPPQSRQRLKSSMESRPDWCVSRQRTWGVPLALFLDKESGQPHALASHWMRRVADRVEKEGVEAWWSLPTQTWLLDEESEDNVVRVNDVLDVWFDSGCVPQYLGQGDVVVEGTDQHRGWFQSCLWLSAALDQDLPFKRVLTHGFVLDQSGDKLSKSRGGDKGKLSWTSYPTDVVRLWALSGQDGHDKVWSEKTVENSQSLLARLRGVVRFLLSNALPELDVNPDLYHDQFPVWDRYWWDKLEQVSQDCLVGWKKGHFHEHMVQLQQFAEVFSAVVLGSWKDRLYCAPAHTAERQQLDRVLKACLGHWELVLSALTPRLMQEAKQYWPCGVSALPSPLLTKEEKGEVEAVLHVRKELKPVLESLVGQKGGNTTRRFSGWKEAPQWEGQLLADALDVGEFYPEAVAWEEAVAVLEGWVGKSPNCVCPRCRKAQPVWVGEVCQVCSDRLGC